MSVRVTSKGQVTIPLHVREALGIRPGSEVEIELHADGARLRRVVEPAQAADLVSSMRGRGDVPLSTDQIMALTRGDG